MIDRRTMLVSGGAALVAASAGLVHGLPGTSALGSSAGLRPDTIADGEELAWADLLANHWDADAGANPVGRQRIRPVGGDTEHWGLTLARDPDDHFGPIWMMQSCHNVISWRARRGDARARSLVALQWTNAKAALGLERLADATTGISGQDDASWKARYLCDVLEVLGDYNAADCLARLIPAATDRFRDPVVPQVRAGLDLRYSPFGLTYKENGGASSGQGQSSTYEVGMGLCALELFKRKRLDGSLAYAMAMSDWFAGIGGTRYVDDHAGCIVRGVVLDPSLYPGKARGESVNAGFGYPKTGISQFLLAGNMGIALLNARLYRLFGRGEHLARALAIAVAIARPQTDFGMVLVGSDARGMIPGWGNAQPGAFLNADAWTDGFYGPEFADEVLTLPGADPTGACRAALLTTGSNIMASRKVGSADRGGRYSADWGGALAKSGTTGLLTGYRSYQDRWNADPGAGREAGRAQIMTNAASISMIQAARVISDGKS